VTDDGASTGKPDGLGFGLRGMRERVTASGGRLTIERGRDGGGWTVAARIAALPGNEGMGDEALGGEDLAGASAA